MNVPWCPVSRVDLTADCDINTLCPVDLDHTDNALPADRAQVDLSSAGDARTDVTAVIEQSVLFLAVADLTQIHFFIGYLPVADSLAMAFAVFESANVLVARCLLDICALSMTHILDPVTVI